MRPSATEVNVKPAITGSQASWVARLYLWVCERLYYELAWWYDLVSWVVSGGQWRRWQAGVWQEVRGSDVLELGFGTGELLIQGADRGLTMVGLDCSPAMMEVARWRAEKAQTTVRTVLGDGRWLPFDDGVFDTAIATFPAGYILEEETLLELRRVLRAGGRVVILGLWVDVDLGWIGRLMPIFYGRPRIAAQDAMAMQVAAAGFVARWVEQQSGRFTVGVLVAEGNVE